LVRLDVGFGKKVRIQVRIGMREMEEGSIKA
jgi:hypothetical protein